MSEAEQAVIDEAFNVFAAWAQAPRRGADSLPRLFDALKDYDSSRFLSVFKEAIREVEP